MGIVAEVFAYSGYGGMTMDQKIKVTSGTWEWEPLQPSRPGNLYEPPKEYQPATVYVENEYGEVVIIAELHDPMYVISPKDEFDTGERYWKEAIKHDLSRSAV